MSASNPRVRRLRKLISSPSERAESGLFVVEGPVLCDEADRAGIAILELFARGDDAGGFETALVLEPKHFDELSPTETPRAPLAVCRIPDQVDLSTLAGWVLVADGIADPGNLGTICRSAEAAGASAVVVTKGTTDPWSPKCVRASAGAVFHVPVVRVSDVAEVNAAGFVTIGTTSHGDDVAATELHGADLDGRVAVVFGNEAHGLAPDVPVARWITIAHAGRSESLNVAMAATVVALHIRSRRVG